MSDIIRFTLQNDMVDLSSYEQGTYNKHKVIVFEFQFRCFFFGEQSFLIRTNQKVVFMSWIQYTFFVVIFVPVLRLNYIKWLLKFF